MSLRGGDDHPVWVVIGFILAWLAGLSFTVAIWGLLIWLGAFAFGVSFMASLIWYPVVFGLLFLVLAFIAGFRGLRR